MWINLDEFRSINTEWIESIECEECTYSDYGKKTITIKYVLAFYGSTERYPMYFDTEKKRDLLYVMIKKQLNKK